MMRWGLALSVLCLLGSIGFWVATTWSEPQVQAPRAPEPRPARAEAAVSPRAGRETAPPLAAPVEVAADEAQVDESPDEPEEIEPPGPEEAVLRGRVAVLSGDLPEGTRVFLAGLAAPAPIVAEGLAESAEAADGPPSSPSEALEPEEFADQRDVTDDGAFEFYVAPGQYRLVARAPGHLPAVLDNLTVAAGDDVRGLVLDLSSGMKISGTVRAEGEPQEGVAVVAQGGAFRLTATTDETGHFELGGLLAGTYQVRAFVESLGGDEREVVAGGQVALELARRGLVSGRVVDERGFAVANAAVYGVSYAAQEELPDQDPFGEVDADTLSGGISISGCGPMPGCRQVAVSDAAGAFQVEVAQGALLSLGAAAGEAHATLEGVPSGAREVVLTVRRAAPVRLVLTDYEGNPAAGRVTVEAQNNRFSFASNEVVAGPDGQAVFYPWPDVGTVLRPEPGLKLTGAGPLPPSVSIEQSRRPYRRHVITLVY